MYSTVLYARLHGAVEIVHYVISDCRIEVHGYTFCLHSEHPQTYFNVKNKMVRVTISITTGWTNSSEHHNNIFSQDTSDLSGSRRIHRTLDQLIYALTGKVHERW